MKKNLFLKILSYLAVALVSCVITLGAVAYVVSTGDNYTKLEQLADLISDRFIGEEDRTAMENAAADAMIQSLGDRWSYYMSAEEYQSYLDQMANSYVGIGVTVEFPGDGFGYRVKQVTKGGPAEAGGVLPEDRILAVDGANVEEIGTEEATKRIKGKAGTQVVLTILRGEEQLDLTLTRAAIKTEVATATMLDGNIGLIKITNFDSRCAEETIAAIESLKEQGAQKLIFDVRYNPGGYKKELVNILNYLLPEGLLFRSEFYDGTQTDDHSDASCLKLPMAVLVNGSSYSAAEFFAAALREYDWATVVGTQTCGKGYFQNTYQLKDGSAVALSVGKYYTPKGVSLAEVGGLTPDRIVEVDDKTAAGIYYGTLDPMEDPQILAAMEELNKD